MSGVDQWLTLPIHDVVVQFTLLVTAALLVQLTVERMALPGLVGLLLIGALLGPGIGGVLPREPVVELLGEIGLVYLLFLAGVEIDLDEARARGSETVSVGLLALIGPALPAVLVGLLLGFSWPGAILMATLISSHTLLAYPLVARLGLQHRPAVVAAVGGTLITDTIALIVLAIVIQVAGGSGNGGNWWTPLLWLASISAAALAGLPRVSRWFLRQHAVRPAEKALYVFAVLLILSAAAELVGTESILGAFLAGLCLNRVLREHEDLWEHIAFMGRMLFLPFFYVSTGMLFEIDALTGSLQIWMLAGALLALVIAGKSGAAWVADRVFAYPPHDRLLLTGLILPQAAATLAIAVTAYEAGLFDRVMVDAVILVIFVTCVAGPLLTRRAAHAVQAMTSSSPAVVEPARGDRPPS